MAARQDDIRVLREREAKIYNTQNGQLKQEWHLDRMIYEYYENEKLKSYNTLLLRQTSLVMITKPLRLQILLTEQFFQQGRSETLSSAKMYGYMYFFRDDKGQPKFTGICSGGKAYYVAQLLQEQLREFSQNAQSSADSRTL